MYPIQLYRKDDFKNNANYVAFQWQLRCKWQYRCNNK